MLRKFSCAFVMLALALGLTQAAELQEKEEPKVEVKKTEVKKDDVKKDDVKKDDKKEAPKDEGMVMQFHDGTSVRLIPLESNLEIITKYGKLTVPTADVRRIEFGLHTPEDLAKQVDEAMKDLESADFQTRENAGKRLIGLGRYSYPTLIKASKGSNLETTRRIQDLLKQMRKQYGEARLKLRTEDTVITKDFTIVGNLASSKMKIKTEHFGEAIVKLTDLRSLRTNTGGGDVEVTLDATKYGSNANTFMETDFTVEGEVPLKITASGSVDVYAQAAGQYISGPEGNNQLGQRGRFIPGQLIGKIGENGQPFLIGPSYSATPTGEGKLYLHIWPFQGGGGATGSYTVKISTGN